ncbi:MAG: response regulator, partial [Oscillospiraceae bacterium]|nr:response regulator [Oscillospiraceae bacterium]
MMGGDISVESEYGKGSVFTARIPQKVVSDAPVGDFQARFRTNVMEAAAYQESFRAPTARILIVDDTRMNLTVVVNLLKNTQMQIDTATSGADAVSMARKTAYDVILMDQRMPEMDGTEALRRIRASAGGASQNAPVVCLTADAVVGARERYLAEGFSDYLTKPVDATSLEKLLTRYLPAHKVVRAQPPRQPEGGEAGDEFAPLVAAGIDPEAGLRYCQGDGAMYRELLWEYARDAEAKARDIEAAHRARDWKEYGIRVHSLKSTSRMIGASELSRLA